jgi:TonB family protein
MTRAHGRIVLAIGAAALLLGTSATAQKTAPAPTIGSTVGQWWKMLGRDLVALADAMPEDKWNFKPATGEFGNVRTFGEQIKHAACANEAFMLEIEHKEPPADCENGGPNPAKTKAEILQYLRQSFARLDALVDTMTAENALDAAGGRYGGQSTRLGLITLAVWHGADHYGQLVVYLRMNGIVPPASRQVAPPAKGLREGNGVSSPRLLYEVKPDYTSEARRARIQGVVTMEAVVLPDGSVGDVRIVRSLDTEFGLDKEAVNTVKKWRFEPGMREGKPVPVLVTVEMSFTLGK